MRVLLVSANFSPSVGGIERYVEHLAQGLVRGGHEATVATLTAATSEEDDRGLDVIRLPSSEVLRSRFGVPYPLPAPGALARTLGALVDDADVVHAQDALYLTTTVALTLAKRRNVPTVLTQHVGFVPQGNAALDVIERVAIATIGRTARLADVVTAYNPDVAVWAKRTWGLRAVRLLPVGVEGTTPARDARVSTRRELGIDEDAFVALFTGRDVAKKRLDVFLAATDPSYELVAVTDGIRETTTARLVPFMPPDSYARVLATADAFVLTSEAEGFPLALQEALTSGVPCVVARHPGFERFLADDEVMFVDPNPESIRHALRQLATDTELRLRLAKRARVAGEREFGVDRFVDAYISLYSSFTDSDVASRSS